MDISIEEFKNLKKRIETLENLMKHHAKEINLIWSNTSRLENHPLTKQNQTKIEPEKFEICILNQRTYCDRGHSWIENEFIPIGIKTFISEDEALNYLNGDVKNLDEEHYYYLSKNIKFYLHNIERNLFKKLRKTPENKFYLKK